MHRTHARLAAALTIAFALSLPAAAGAEVQILTSEDPGRPFTVIESYPAIVYQQFQDFSLKGDPLQNAVVEGLKKMRVVAERHDADAVIGTRIEFANRTSKDEGRVLVYGTLVRFD